MLFNRHKFDAFIVHAVEDKQGVANTLYQKLSEASFNVWYSSKHLVPGESLVSVIHRGLRLSRCGILIISPKFLEKRWPQREYHILLAADVFIIPILCGVTAEQVTAFDPDLANIYSLDVTNGVNNVADGIASVLAARRRELSVKRLKTYAGVFTALFVLLSVFMFKAGWDSNKKPSSSEIRELVRNYLNSVSGPRSPVALSSLGQSLDKKKVIEITSEFLAQKSYYRNEYEFSSSFITLKGKKNVREKLGVDPTKFLQQDDLRLTKALEIPPVVGKPRELHYTLTNTDSVSFALVDGKYDEASNTYDVVVNYTHNIRSVVVDLTFATKSSDRRINLTSITGFFPREHYHFKRTSRGWVTDKILLAEEN